MKRCHINFSIDLVFQENIYVNARYTDYLFYCFYLLFNR